MHPEQVEAINEVAERADRLSDLIMRVCHCDEDTALNIVHDLPQVVQRLQANDIQGLLKEAVERVPYRSIPPKPMPIPAHQLYPGHPNFLPPVTTKSAFNAHVAQAMSPYVKAVVDRVAKDRELEPPDLKTIEAVLEKTDWARAAYEAKKMPPKPPPSKLRQFFKKYVFGPLDAVTDKVPLAHFWGYIGAAQILLILWTALGGTLARVERAGAPVKVYDMMSRRKQARLFQKYAKKSGMKWPGGGVY